MGDLVSVLVELLIGAHGEVRGCLAHSWLKLQSIIDVRGNANFDTKNRLTKQVAPGERCIRGEGRGGQIQDLITGE